MRTILPSWISFTQLWGKPGVGRFCKRQVSKARRRAIKEELKTGNPPRRRGEKAESDCEYKMW